MSHHLLVEFDGVIECSDPVWARNQYSPDNIHTLSDVEGVFVEGEDFQVQIKPGGDQVSAYHKTKALCEGCKTAILWDRIISLQYRIEAMEERLGNLS